MQEESGNQVRTKWPIVRQWVTCVMAYGMIWAFTFSLLWFAVSAGWDSLVHIANFGHFLLSLAFSILCPEWYSLTAGLLLGLMTCLGMTLRRGAILASLMGSLLPASAIFFMFGFSPSGVLPALCTVAASWLGGSILARTWQQPLFSLPYSGRPFAAKRVVVTLVWLLALSTPFRLFQWAGEAWAGVLNSTETETGSLASPDGIYTAITHNVDPNLNAYTEIIIRPRHSVWGLFCGYSGTSRIGGVERVQWTGKRTLCIWRDYDAGVQHWNDVRIIYIDTSSPEDKRDHAAMKKDMLEH